MRRTASEVLRQLEGRIARLEKQSGASNICLIVKAGMSGAEFSVPWEARNTLKKHIDSIVEKNGFGTKKKKFEMVGKAGGTGDVHTYKLMIRPGDIDVVIKELSAKMECVVG